MLQGPLTYLAALVLLTLSSWTTSSRAASFEYQAPSACPSAQEVARRWNAAAPTFVHITQTKEGYHGVARSSAAERALDDPSCAVLVDALLLVLSMSELPVAPPAPAPVERPRSVRAFVAATAGATLGLHPGPAPVFGLRGGARYAALRFEATLASSIPLRAERDGRSAVFYSGLAGARACAWFGGRFSGGSCLGGEATLVRGAGRGVSERKSGTMLTFAPTLAVGAELALSHRVSLAAECGMALPLDRPTFQIANQPVHRAAWANGRLLLGITLWL